MYRQTVHENSKYYIFYDATVYDIYSIQTSVEVLLLKKKNIFQSKKQSKILKKTSSK